MKLHDEERKSASVGRTLVLCVDKDTFETVTYWLGQAGHIVDTPQSGTRAAKMLRSSHYDAFVTDRFLPPWPGLDGIPRLKKRFPNVRLVVLLRHAPVGLGAIVRLAGADAVVEAPLRQADLLTAVAHQALSTTSTRPIEY